MAKGSKLSPKSLIRATEDSLAIYEGVAEDSPEDTPIILVELLTNKGIPTKGLRRWRLKQISGVGEPHFSQVLTFLIDNKIVEVR